MIRKSYGRTGAVFRADTDRLPTPDDDESLRGITRTLGPLRASVVTVDAGVVVERQGCEPGEILVGLPLDGTILVGQDGVEASIGVSELVALDGSRPHQLAALKPARMVVVRAEHHLLGLVPGRTVGLTARPWSAGSGVYALAADTLACVARDLEEIAEDDADALGLMIADLVGCLFADQLRMWGGDHGRGRQALTVKVLCHVRGRLADVDLTPEHVARHFDISLRYLQMLFAELGTSPAKWIRDQRLSRLRHDLADPRLDHLTVSTLGEKWGILGASQVSRLFRAAYGVTPSEFRRLRSVAPAFVNAAAPLRGFDTDPCGPPINVVAQLPEM